MQMQICDLDHAGCLQIQFDYEINKSQFNVEITMEL